MSNPTTSALLFLVQILFDLYLFVVLLRFLLQCVRADFYNPVCQFVVKLTNIFVLPLRRLIPGLFGLDMATLVLWVLITAAKLTIISTIMGYSPAIPGLMVWTLQDALSQLTQFYFYALLIFVILSWVGGHGHPVAMILLQLVGPVLRPIQRVIPPISGFDLSPIVAFIAIQLINILVISPFGAIAQSMM